MDQVLIQLVMDAQGEVSLEYLADLVRRLPPEKIVKLLTHLAAELDKDARSCRPASRSASCPRGSARCHTRLSRDWRRGVRLN